MKHKTGTGWQSGTVVTYFLFTPDYQKAFSLNYVDYDYPIHRGIMGLENESE